MTNSNLACATDKRQQLNWNDFFEYRDGKLFWKISLSNRAKAGARAGTFDSNMYRQIRVMGRIYKEHRIVYEMFFGPLPQNVSIDHIDRNPSNNKIENLRAATQSQNMANTSKQSNNKSGYKGVFWCNTKSKWCAKIQVRKKAIHIGYFDQVEKAAAAYKAASIKFFGQFSRME